MTTDPPAGPEPAATPEPGATAAEPESSAEPAVATAPPAVRPRRPWWRRRGPRAGALIGVLTMLLGFALAVQVRNNDTDQVLAGAREEDLVRILEEVTSRGQRLREQIADERAALRSLTSSDSRSAGALEEARQRADELGVLTGTLPAVGPGLRITVRDPDGVVRVSDLLDTIQELRGAGAETMQVDGVRVGLSTAVTGEAGALLLDGRPLTAPYEFVVLGDPQNIETALNIPGGVVQSLTGRGATVVVTQEPDLLVDAVRPRESPRYASPDD